MAGRVSPESRIKPIPYATDPGFPAGESGGAAKSAHSSVRISYPAATGAQRLAVTSPFRGGSKTSRTSARRDDYQSALDPLRVTISQISGRRRHRRTCHRLHARRIRRGCQIFLQSSYPSPTSIDRLGPQGPVMHKIRPAVGHPGSDESPHRRKASDCCFTTMREDS